MGIASFRQGALQDSYAVGGREVRGEHVLSGKIAREE
jgi:hypothetical protein